MATCPTDDVCRTLAPAEEVERVSAQLKAIAHPVRLQMLTLIAGADGEVCICRIQDRFDLSQPTLSHHASVLRDAGLIRSRQEGVWVHHSIVPEAFERVLRFLTDLLPVETREVGA